MWVEKYYILIFIIRLIYNNDLTDIYVYDNNEIISNEIIKNENFYEVDFLKFIRKHFYSQNEILDIGANIGNHSLYFSKFLDSKKIHSFEPFPSNLILLKKNLENFEEKTIIYDYALSNKTTKLPLFNSQKNNSGGFSLHKYDHSFYANIDVNVITLDSLNLKNISMIKIDVENHENEVLEGAFQTITDNKPIIFIENLYHGFPKVCPDINVHKKIFEKLNYIKKYSNIENSFMDLWVYNDNL